MAVIDYNQMTLSEAQAENLALTHFNIKGKAQPLAGEIDFNFKITTATGDAYILKVSRPEADLEYLDFQVKILEHIAQQNPHFDFPKLIKNREGIAVSTVIDDYGRERHVRMIAWIKGRLWSSVNPQLDDLRFSLGEKCGEVTKILRGFDHPAAHRSLDWDVAQAAWTEAHLHLFEGEKKRIIQHFQTQFRENLPVYAALRKSVIHNDANDNNIVVSADLRKPQVMALIDYGDAVHSQVVNDLAVALAYAVMNHPDPLAAALPLVAGYHKNCPLEAAELAVLYNLVAMRLVISVTKSAINKIKEPDNTYLLISEKPAWEVLEKWEKIPPSFAHYAFRNACGMTAMPSQTAFEKWASEQDFSLKTMFPSLTFKHVLPVDLSIGSTFLGNFSEYQNDAIFTAKMLQLQLENLQALLAGGYLEARAVYTTKAYEREGNSGFEYRTIHLGLDVWADARTPIHAFMEGEVYGFHNNNGRKDYGPTIILKHVTEGGLEFYTLYGHLSLDSLDGLFIGKTFKKGEKIAFLGKNDENGDWPPHLHFQILLDTLGNKHDFAGVGFPSEIAVWSSICPDPNVLFKDFNLKKHHERSDAALITYRKAHLGKSLSLSYSEPLKILRGEMQYLIDAQGRKYLDTVNNVAHAGHEHPSVVRAGQAQMAVLNTNTRYLHESILDFARELLATFPPELSVVHFVNSGSEANELALRMAQAVTNQKDMIALEVGYHGNTNGCIAISSYKFNGKGGKGKPEHTEIVPLPDSFRGIYQGELSETGARYAAHVQEAIDVIHAKGRGVAGFIAESIVSCGGQIDLPDNYLKLAYDAVRKASGVCIADEVQVGFGRVGKKFWGFELQDVVPDIVTMGKPIGNGHPLAAVVCTRAVADAFANGMEYFNTFGGNPVSCAIGLEVLNVIKKDKLQENAYQVGEYLKAELNKMKSKFPLIGDVRGQGLFLGFELVEPGKVPATAKTSYLADRMKAHGILMSVDGPQNNVLKIKPPMCFSMENADLMLHYLNKVLAEDFMQ
jgi:4-aminobutyrate aminotransferase-like enzyme/Ser/Thr protein kinase RdoA (MazF antagonist)